MLKRSPALLFLFVSFPALAALSSEESARLEEARALFAKGAYAQSIEQAEGIQRADAETAFFLASAYARIQAFDKAIPYYQRALAGGSREPSLHYDYGQAFFATNQLKEAEQQFKQSIMARFKVSASAYYVAYVRQLLEDPAGAKDFYQRIQRLARDPDGVKQPALYQLAELGFDQASSEEDKTKRAKFLETEVLPLYRRARDFAPGTPTFEQAKVKIAEIEREISANGERMRNGMPIPRQAHTLRFSQDFSYDSNVITEADDALIEVSDKDSFVSRTAMLAKYQWNIGGRVSLIPELSTSYTLHSRRSTPRVYQNDNFVVAPALRTKWEHMSRGSPATALLDIEFNLMLRDYEQQHKLPFYSRYWNIIYGERIKWFDTGTTTFKLAIKFYESYDPSRNSYSPQVTFQQNIRIFGAYDLQNSIILDFLRARDDFNDERNYKFRQTVTFPKFAWKWDFTPSLAFNLRDTMKQKGTRGNELLINPSLSFNREFTDHIEGNFEYAFSKNISKAKDLYQYTKHELKVGAAYRF